MKKFKFLIILYLLMINYFCHTQNQLPLGEFMLERRILDHLEIGDTLMLRPAKERPHGTIKLATDNNIYEWGMCYLNQKKVTWCKIGTWTVTDYIEFNTYCRIIKLKYILTEADKQKLIVADIK